MNKPRSRGRPPKVAAFEPRSRGRPPKIATPTEQVANITSSIDNCRVAFPTSLGVSSDRPRGRPPKVAAQAQQVASTTLSIGNCRVAFPTSLGVSSDPQGLCINLPNDAGTIHITKDASDPHVLETGFSIALLNPKALDGPGKLVLEDVLKLYSRELPEMKYAANTGKESRFLETCVRSGKYSTLVLRNATLEVIGAVTYQILAADAHQAEIPLAAIAQVHHRKGLGTYLFKELQRRLEDVGVLSIFCWGDQESLAFWGKQGFVTVAEVDGKGKPWKLPIKSDVRRALSIPGSATLMISYFSSPSIRSAAPHLLPPAAAEKSQQKYSPEASPLRQSPPLVNGAQARSKLSPPVSITTPHVVGESKSAPIHSITPELAMVDSAHPGKFSFASITPLNMESMLSNVSPKSTTPSAPPGVPRTSYEITTTGPPPASTNENVELASDANLKPLKKRRFVVNFEPSPERKSDEARQESVLENIGNQPNLGSRDLQPPQQLSVPAQKENAEPEMGGSTVEPSTALVHRKEKAEDPLIKGVKRRTALRSGKHSCSSSGGVAEGHTGVKRSRGESEAQTKMVGRRSAPRRKAPDRLCNTNREGEDSVRPRDGAEGTTEEDVGRGDEGNDDPQLMVDLLLPQLRKGAGWCRASSPAERSASAGLAEAAKSLRKESNDPDGVARDSPGAHTEMVIEEEKAAPSLAQRAEEAFIDQIDRLEKSSSSKTSDWKNPVKLHLQKNYSCGVPASTRKTGPVIMFMNMADESQKKQLTKHVERLGGEVTTDGFHCTHVITGEVRRTLNFCVAISSGAWILSPDWLKVSVKQKNFADESRFILRDRKFEARYKIPLKEVIRRAQQRPNLLFGEMTIYVTPHVHPPASTISQIIKAAGGQILGTLEEALQLEDKSNGAAIACEEDMSYAMSAAKAGLRTFNSDWLLTCVVKQELELAAIQFSESL